MKVFNVHVNGSIVASRSIEDAFEIIKNEVLEGNGEEEIDVRITSKEMTEEEYNALGEFDGF